MKLSIKWLKEWLDLPLNASVLAQQLTMLGLEVKQITKLEPAFSKVIIAQVEALNPHPNADHLHVCSLNIGEESPIEVICGATNVREGLKVAWARIGARLPQGKIKKKKLRGVNSYGMICACDELGLSDGALDQIMELPEDAPIGLALEDYLALDDAIIDMDITPNRGDCLSVLGVSRELAALYHLEKPKVPSLVLTPKITKKAEFIVLAKERCPRYLGRMICDVHQVTTPTWMQERLKRSGLRPIHFIVDVTNYVMLELGQPLHAFDLEKLNGNLEVRLAQDGERLTLLDTKTLTLDNDALVIADQKAPCALAGIMGGLHASVTPTTQHIFLESAYFTPSEIMLTARRFRLQTESSYRFERGVDYQMQKIAIERASQLIVQYAGGQLTAVNETVNHSYLPQPLTIKLRHQAIGRVLGLSIDKQTVEDILKGLGMQYWIEPGGWQVQVPSYRTAVYIEEDLIEEIARIYGYDQISSKQDALVSLNFSGHATTFHHDNQWYQTLKTLGYHETMTYSFISGESWQKPFFSSEMIPLAHPISNQMAVMRESLWPGLIQTALNNLNYQQKRGRFFEIGTCFYRSSEKKIEQARCLSGLVYGTVIPKQWASCTRTFDFFDLKSDVECLLALLDVKAQWHEGSHQALHPGRCAILKNQSQTLGYVGQLHPRIALELGSPDLYLFELFLNWMPTTSTLPCFKPWSKFPEVSRDLSFILNQEISMAEIQALVFAQEKTRLKSCQVIDVYQGHDIPKNKKSITLSLMFQSDHKTLCDEQVNKIMHHIANALECEFFAILRT